LLRSGRYPFDGYRPFFFSLARLDQVYLAIKYSPRFLEVTAGYLPVLGNQNGGSGNLSLPRVTNFDVTLTKNFGNPPAVAPGHRR
jgi:hypothetical protein